ncbi:hypothetical protein GCM10011515_01570 [Tsuneonella deserti]|uniref:AMIN domain-containing protein n=1 Tax=Tsuneonella deserti TaxID=2035528 RepID=A0ABQ1RZ33_9SPHN|nr:hypothetical protein [Tsuneonella deserti]GGD85612.1 hypothetical protein GCM10011515_01570 [Tsuneonella deserti]
MSILGLILFAQAAAPGAATSPPDIEIRARADIKSLEIHSGGKAELALHAHPGEAPPVEITRSLPTGRKTYRNLRIDLRGIARLTAPEPIIAIKNDTGDP